MDRSLPHSEHVTFLATTASPPDSVGLDAEFKQYNPLQAGCQAGLPDNLSDSVTIPVLGTSRNVFDIR
jgi:hypothetical protein